MQIFAVIFLISIIVKNRFAEYFKKNGLLIGFLLAFFALLISFFYSEIIGYPVCDLCWIQRVLMVVMLLSFGVSFFFKRKYFPEVGLISSILGVLVSIYHIFIENGLSSKILCSVTNSVSCSIRYVYEFGYITIPIMALTLFIIFILIFINNKKPLI